MLPTVLSALEKVHPTERAPMAGDTLWLKPGNVTDGIYKSGPLII